MNQYQIASYIVSSALRASNRSVGEPIDASTMIALSGAVSTTVSVYGYKDKKAIKKSALKVTPKFDAISEIFFTVLAEAPVISELAHSKNYDEICEFILEYAELSPKERLKLYAEEYASPNVKIRKIFRIVCLSLTIIGILIQIGVYLFVPEYRNKFLENWKHLRNHAEKTKKHACRFWKALKFLIHQITK